MQDALAVQRIELKFRALRALMDERMRRQWVAVEARAYGWGGIRAVSAATGMSATTIRKGLAELRSRSDRPGEPLPTRLRAAGGGRKRKTESDPGLSAALEVLVDSATRGEDRIAAAMDLQEHADRNAQFEYINHQAKAFMRRGQPVISVDTKKKELAGEFKNGGREGMPRGEPDEVRVHDFLDKTLGKAIPYGVYDITQNWRGRPLVSHEVIVHLIANTVTRQGLKIRAALDKRRYAPGIKVSDEELARVNLRPRKFHGDWNYTIQTRISDKKSPG